MNQPKEEIPDPAKEGRIKVFRGYVRNLILDLTFIVTTYPGLDGKLDMVLKVNRKKILSEELIRMGKELDDQTKNN